MPAVLSSLSLILLLVSGSITIGLETANGQTFDPYSAFQQMSPGQLTTLQGKVTFVGPRLSLMSSVGFAANGHVFNYLPFVPFYRAAMNYVGDAVEPETFTATTQQLKALIDSVATLPNVTDGGVDANGYVSFALCSIMGGDTIIFESVVDTINGRPLFQKMSAALAGNDSAIARLSNFACATNMLPTAAPQDVSGSVSVRVRGMRLERRSGLYAGTFRVTNTSIQSLAPPLILVLGAEGNVDLAKPDGKTCRILPAGYSYVTIPVGTGLAPGGQVELTAQFENPDFEVVKFTIIKVYQGQGTR